jgi:hypothetical protein
MDTRCAFFDVWTEFLDYIKMSFGFKRFDDFPTIVKLRTIDIVLKAFYGQVVTVNISHLSCTQHAVPKVHFV